MAPLAGDGGVQAWGFAQNCVEVYPKWISQTNAISDVSCDVLMQKVKDFLRN
jgi:succinate dehydrogenase/fumarate reductase-like Fe-S protein